MIVFVIILLLQVGWEMRTLTSEYGSKQMSSFHVLGFHFDLYFNPGLFADEHVLNQIHVNGLQVSNDNEGVPEA